MERCRSQDRHSFYQQCNIFLSLCSIVVYKPPFPEKLWLFVKCKVLSLNEMTKYYQVFYKFKDKAIHQILLLIIQNYCIIIKRVRSGQAIDHLISRMLKNHYNNLQLCCVDNESNEFNVKEVAYSDNAHTSSGNTEYCNLNTLSVMNPGSLGVSDFLALTWANLNRGDQSPASSMLQFSSAVQIILDSFKLSVLVSWF